MTTITYQRLVNAEDANKLSAYASSKLFFYKVLRFMAHLDFSIPFFSNFISAISFFSIIPVYKMISAQYLIDSIAKNEKIKSDVIENAMKKKDKFFSVFLPLVYFFASFISFLSISSSFLFSIPAAVLIAVAMILFQIIMKKKRTSKNPSVKDLLGASEFVTKPYIFFMALSIAGGVSGMSFLMLEGISKLTESVDFAEKHIKIHISYEK